MTNQINPNLFDDGPIVVFTWDGETDSNNINPMRSTTPNVERLLGYTPEDFITKKVIYGELIHPDDVTRVYTKIDANFKSKLFSFTDQYRLRRRDGIYIWVNAHAHITVGENNLPERLDGYIVDITDLIESKEREEKQRIEKITAEKMSLNKSQFLANMSHEIRTPMNGVLGMADILSNTELTQKQEDIVNVIVKSSNALLTIINDILDFSKLEAGKVELDEEPFNINEAIYDVTTLLQAGLKLNDVDLLVRIAPDIRINVIGDVGRFRQILINLIGNAIKFTERGHVLIEVTSQDIERDLTYLKVGVHDTGLGIGKEKLKTIFENFNQADNSTTRVFGGTGLGLSIARDLAQLMHGDISVKSTLGQGSSFEFSCKLKQCTNIQDNSKKIIDVFNGKPPTAIILDDNSVNLAIITEQLNQLGYECLAYNKPRDAIQAIIDSNNTNTDRFLILDYHMPKINGETFYKALSEKGLMKNLSTVMMTSVDDDTLRKRVLALGVEEFLTKPVKTHKLHQTLLSLGINSAAPVQAA